MKFSEIQKRNYEATKKRGLITTDTRFMEFVEKLKEETRELEESFHKRMIYDNVIFDPTELADVMLVCTAIAQHYNVDILKVMEEKMKYNETRK